MNYPAYTNNSQFYMQNLQDMRDRIDSQIRNYQQNQTQQPVTQPQPQIHQSFQLAPQSSFSEIQAKYVSDINDVKNTFVMSLGVFLNKDFSTLWIKDVTGKIRTFATEEIIEMDEKDKEIYMLKQELENMKGMIENDNKSDNTNVDDEITKTKSSRVSNGKRSTTK